MEQTSPPSTPGKFPTFGEVDWLPYLKEFYQGDKGLEHQVQDREEHIDPTEARTGAA